MRKNKSGRKQVEENGLRKRNEMKKAKRKMEGEKKERKTGKGGIGSRWKKSGDICRKSRKWMERKGNKSRDRGKKKERKGDGNGEQKDGRREKERKWREANTQKRKNVKK